MGRVCSQTIDSLVNWGGGGGGGGGGHDVLLDTNLDLLDSMVESSGQHNRNLMGHTLRKVWS